MNIERIRIGEAAYPERLLEIKNPPKQLYCCGDSGLLKSRCVAVVGSRTTTVYGRRTAEAIGDPAGKTVVVMHADAPDEAQRMKEKLKEKLPGLKEIRIQMIGPVIGAHCGPGTVAFAFIGKERTN